MDKLTNSQVLSGLMIMSESYRYSLPHYSIRNRIIKYTLYVCRSERCANSNTIYPLGRKEKMGINIARYTPSQSKHGSIKENVASNGVLQPTRTKKKLNRVTGEDYRRTSQSSDQRVSLSPFYNDNGKTSPLEEKVSDQDYKRNYSQSSGQAILLPS